MSVGEPRNSEDEIRVTIIFEQEEPPRVNDLSLFLQEFQVAYGALLDSEEQISHQIEFTPEGLPNDRDDIQRYIELPRQIELSPLQRWLYLTEEKDTHQINIINAHRESPLLLSFTGVSPVLLLVVIVIAGAKLIEVERTTEVEYYSEDNQEIHREITKTNVRYKGRSPKALVEQLRELFR